MNKNIVLLICLTSISPLAFSNQLPDFCKSGAFTCEQISPNSVVAYPVSNVKTNHNEKRHVTVENDNDTEKNMQLSDAILVDLKKLTWGAYDGTGELIRSGRVSGGKDYCPDIDRECKTVTGRFTIFRKGGEDCKSTIY
ncbi:MAG TPA: L,D-transpeptidase, partial [Candidatus Berkiella sp.]|nr:L,D-transpeptidase [Candidatus Berkiella sp.]